MSVVEYRMLRVWFIPHGIGLPISRVWLQFPK